MNDRDLRAWLQLLTELTKQGGWINRPLCQDLWTLLQPYWCLYKYFMLPKLNHRLKGCRVLGDNNYQLLNIQYVFTPASLWVILSLQTGECNSKHVWRKKKKKQPPISLKLVQLAPKKAALSRRGAAAGAGAACFLHSDCLIQIKDTQETWMSFSAWLLSKDCHSLETTGSPSMSEQQRKDVWRNFI